MYTAQRIVLHIVAYVKVGVGMPMDGIKQNPVVYDLMSKMAFHQNKVDAKVMQSFPPVSHHFIFVHLFYQGTEDFFLKLRCSPSFFFQEVWAYGTIIKNGFDGKEVHTFNQDHNHLFEWNARTQITMGYYDNTGGSKSSWRLWLLPQAFPSSSKRLLLSSGSYTFQILNTEFGKWPRFPVEGLEKIMDKASKQLAEKSEDIPGGKQRRCTEHIRRPVALLQIQWQSEL
ncbi:hypothetical protein POTOM_050479 [Populus tomentosa]|uniref:Uncharacterized protein n=1 Tax=Populus tomentosa TaxID=118781 RepID=A0A8X8C831_POPTO|nr:hypothetical protein POTOM_050479 [Populus tomentosa]